MSTSILPPCAVRSVPVLLGLFLAALAVDPLPGAAAEPSGQRSLAVTVDDLPIAGRDEGAGAVTSINRRIVDALVDAKVPAVGFVNEEKLYRAGEVDERIAALSAWLDAGLDLGNHTSSHPDFHKVGLAAYEEEIVRGETVTRRLLEAHGKKLRWFRQTFLRTGKTKEERDALATFLVARGYTAAPVTIENDDWWFESRYSAALRKGDEALAKRIAAAYLDHWTTMFDFYEGLTEKLFHRQIPQVILIHGNRLNADHLPEVLALMQKRGYSFTTLDAALADPAYRHEDPYVGKWGKSWLQRWLLSDGVDTLGKEPEPPEWLEELPEK